MRNGDAAGFTLLEMLIALVIAAVAIASVTLALKPDDRRILADEADRLALLMEQAREETALGGLPIAWVASEHGYEFQQRELAETGANWQVIRGDDLLRPRSLPTGMLIRAVRVDQIELAQGERVALSDDNPRRISVELALGSLLRIVELGDDDHFQVRPLDSGAS